MFKFLFDKHFRPERLDFVIKNRFQYDSKLKFQEQILKRFSHFPETKFVKKENETEEEKFMRFS